MERECTVRLAGAAFRMITGQDLKREYLDRPEAPKSTDASKDEEEEEGTTGQRPAGG
jgi:hypothetical protein